jgi:hypothetical protein
VGNASEIRDLPGKDLAPPDSSVIPIPNAIDRYADAGSCGNRCNVRTVVLHGNEFKPVI